jgi:stress-induced-phosphoprotein 1
MSAAGFLKMFGEEGMRRISADPALSPCLRDPVFCDMIADIADHPENIVNYQNNPRLQPALMTILPIMLSSFPKPSTEPRGPQPPIVTDAESEKELGNECFKNGDFQNALFHYNNAIQIDPKNMIYYSNKSTALTKLKRFEDAMEAALLAVETGQLNNATDEQVAKVYVKLANAALGCGKDNGALTALHESLHLKEDPVVRKMYTDLDKRIHPKD